MEKQKPSKKHFTTIDEYIGSSPENVQNILQRIRQVVQNAAPQAIEVISYQVPAFKLKGKYLVYFAAWKDHIAMYPIPAATGTLKEELEPYLAGKGTIRLPLGKPMPYDLVEKIIHCRLIGFD